MSSELLPHSPSFHNSLPEDFGVQFQLMSDPLSISQVSVEYSGFSRNIETLDMSRSRKVSKKSKGTFFKGRNITSSSNSTLDADTIKKGTQIATVNTRYVYAMRSIGRDAEARRMFCALINISLPTY
ncbi:hypothetical protein NPIL_511811 [Nephila pilipes]|uniref:Uncharacterized protein n=1 Tax=Nephila pilipes TaxID=299642 RepID=A0A8X6QZ58_NEPPI|nr:hypothetical protein NPIL_511811 [Nephila pilipes]